MEEIIKIRVEIGEIKSKHAKIRINKHKTGVLKDE